MLYFLMILYFIPLIVLKCVKYEASKGHKTDILYQQILKLIKIY